MRLYKRGSTWWISFCRNGKRVRRSTGAKKRGEAEAFADALRLACRAPNFGRAMEILRLAFAEEESRDAGVIRLDGAWEAYERIARSVGRDRVSDKVWRHRRERVARFARWAEINRPGISFAREVDGPTAAAFAASLLEEGLKSGTRRNILAELSQVWRMLGKAEDGIGDPFRGLTPPDTDARRLEAFSPEQARKIIEAAGKVGKGWRLACLIAAHTGLRYGDVARLRWRDVDMAEGVIRVTPAKTARHGTRVAVPMAPELREAMSEALGSALLDPELAGAAEWVLPGHAALYGDQGRGAYDALNFREVLDAAGISGRYTFHSWRHYFRTRLAAAGVGTETAMRLCGHTTREMSDRYDHDEHLQELRDAVAALGQRGSGDGAWTTPSHTENRAK